jgi:hypothetical protein
VFELSALYEADSTIAALAVDTDDDRTTGGGTWEGLGVSSDGWDVLRTFTSGDPATNLIVGRMPVPDGDVWRVQALLAQADGTVMNVAFRGTDERTQVGAWFEDLQAAALAAGDISAFSHTVTVADLRGGVTRPAELVPGYHSRVYTSQYTLEPGEGMGYEPHFGRHGDTGNLCEQAFHFFGRYQSYGIYIPDESGPHGLQLALHGCNANHSSLVDLPGFQGRFGDDLNRIVVVPLGRGPVGYYSDISERDVLDVLADVHATYEIDTDRVFSGGYSMGGYGAYRFAQLYPHLFAGMANWVGFTGDCTNNQVTDDTGGCPSGAIGNVIDFVGNLRHIPSALLYAAGDELVHATSAQAMADEFRALEVPYEFFFHPAAEHLTFALADGWEKEAAFTKDLTLLPRPARVTYRTDPSLAFPEYDLAHDRAYWVSEIAGREEGYVDVDVLSAGGGGSTPTYETGRDAGVGPAALPWVSDFRRIAGEEPLAQANRLDVTLGNVSGLTVDVAEACLTPAAVTYRVVTDGPSTLRLSDGRAVLRRGRDARGRAARGRWSAVGCAGRPVGPVGPGGRGGGHRSGEQRRRDVACRRPGGHGVRVAPRDRRGRARAGGRCARAARRGAAASRRRLTPPRYHSRPPSCARTCARPGRRRQEGQGCAHTSRIRRRTRRRRVGCALPCSPTAARRSPAVRGSTSVTCPASWYGSATTSTSSPGSPTPRSPRGCAWSRCPASTCTASPTPFASPVATSSVT